jgi:hypothetical protein
VRRWVRPLEPQPLTAELIEELGSGGPWKSDDEFERWMDILAAAMTRPESIQPMAPPQS